MEAVLHISLELFILGLSLALIKNLQMPRAQKTSAAAVFGVAIITIITGLLRTMALVSSNSGLNLEASTNISISMQLIEPRLAVIVCTLPAYKILVAKYSKRKMDAEEKRQNVITVAAAPRQMREPRRYFGIQDSITELEMA